ncbi:MAG: hypothetical protein ACPLTR_11810 [Thermacetogeniaceae bacterium]
MWRRPWMVIFGTPASFITSVVVLDGPFLFFNLGEDDAVAGVLRQQVGFDSILQGCLELRKVNPDSAGLVFAGRVYSPPPAPPY